MGDLGKIEWLEWDGGEVTVYFEDSPVPWTAKMFNKGSKTKDFLDAIEGHLTKQIDKFNGEE